jgi:hypothetical protein
VADSRERMLCIPAPLAASLVFELDCLRKVSVADGRELQVPLWGR